MKVRGIIPEKAVPILGRIYQWVMTDAGVFLILGTAFFSKGLIYFIKGVPRFSEHVLETNLTQELLGGLWVFFGILMFCGCFIKNTYYQASLIGLSVGILMMWGLEFFKYETSVFLPVSYTHLTLPTILLV